MMKLAIELLCLFHLLSYGLSSVEKPLFRAARDADKTGRYIVVLRDDTDDQKFDGILRRAVLLSNDKRAYGIIRTVEKAFTLKLNAISLGQIRSWPEVKHVEEEQMASGFQDPTVPWHLDRLDQQGGSRDFQYSPQNTGQGVDVYVLDTGINYDHEEFEHRAKYAGYDPVDEYYDDPPQRGRDCNGHGTHVASLAGGKTYGTAKQVNLYSVRVLDCSNFAPWSVVLDGMDYVAKLMKEKKRPMVVTMSLGGPYQPAANEAVQNLHNMGAVVVVAAGNGKKDSCNQSPSGSKYAITVGGSNGTDNLYWKGSGTNYGKCVDIFAPGESITAANHSCNNCSKVLSGTSMSAPMVSGIVAMYLQKQPLLSPEDVRKKLKEDSVRDKLDFSLFPDEAKPFTPNLLLQTQGGCGGLYPFRTHLNISSPNYPGDYPPLQLCQWKISADPGQEIALTIHDLDLEKNYDYLIVCEGEACLYDNVKARYTGDMESLKINSSVEFTLRFSSQHLTVLLHTDYTESGRGFSATFTKYYRGTPLIVHDSGAYLPNKADSTHKPAHVRQLLGIRAENAKEVVSNWNGFGYGMSWVDVHQDQVTGAWFYDFLFHNSTLNPTRGFVELNSSEVKQIIAREKRQGMITEIVTARLKDDQQLYAIVFKKYSELMESHTFIGLDLYPSVITRGKLSEAGWLMVCHHLLSAGKLKISAVFHRDKRKRYGVQPEEKREPSTLNYYGFDFFQFSAITLAVGRQNYYPRYVSAYYPNGERETRLSVIYEERVPETTFYHWFRWGLNATEVEREITNFEDSWSPVLLCTYLYRDTLSYMVVWGVKVE